jgi:hypothetical protein
VVDVIWLRGRESREGAGDRGAGLGGFGPQSKAELAQGEHKGAREVRGRYWHDTAAPPSRGVARWGATGRGAKDPTDDPVDPAELHVACALLMAFDGTCEREGVQRNEHPRELGRAPLH